MFKRIEKVTARQTRVGGLTRIKQKENQATLRINPNKFLPYGMIEFDQYILYKRGYILKPQRQYFHNK